MRREEKVEQRDVIITAVGMGLGVLALASIVAGAVGWDEGRDGYIQAGNLGLGLSCFGITGLVGLYERDPEIWRYPRAWAFGLVGALFIVAALVTPSATGWLFQILVEVM